MTHCAVDMPSYTLAMKAQKILKARGYTCEVKRNQSNSDAGCGYYINFSGDCIKAKEILEKYSIPFEKLRKENIQNE